jgi:hypothetical protein
MRELLGKYCIDLSKLVFGGAVLSAIMKEDISLSLIVLTGGSVVFILAFSGFLLLNKKEK